MRLDPVLTLDFANLTNARPMHVCKVSQRVRDMDSHTTFHLTVLQTAMNVLRMVKLFGWENKMKDRISEKRDEELVWLRKRQILDLINNNLK